MIPEVATEIHALRGKADRILRDIEIHPENYRSSPPAETVQLMGKYTERIHSFLKNKTRKFPRENQYNQEFEEIKSIYQIINRNPKSSLGRELHTDEHLVTTALQLARTNNVIILTYDNHISQIIGTLRRRVSMKIGSIVYMPPFSISAYSPN